MSHVTLESLHGELSMLSNFVRARFPIQPDNRSVEVMINAGEVQRLLGISNSTLQRWVRVDRIITMYDNEHCQSNRYRLSEIQWLMRQDYKNLSSVALHALLLRKKEEYRP